MNDYGHEQTDKMLAKLERQIKREYRTAYVELKKKVDSYYDRFAQLDLQKQANVKDGTISKEEYAEWRKNKMLTGKRWDDMLNSISNDLTHSTEIATSLINSNNIDVYTLNTNYALYEIENGIHGGIDLTLYDRATVGKLFREGDIFIPQAKVNIPKESVWNKKHITSAITQGIIQGESINKIADRLVSVTNMSTSAAIRNARTFTTAAENGGRIDRYKAAEAMGIKMQKEWLATMDNRTRHEHRFLDGQRRDIDKPFEVDGYALMYPGDPSAEGYLIYNCRCTMISQIAGYEEETKKYDLPNMTYEEWKGDKEERQGEGKQEPPIEKQEPPKPKTPIVIDGLKKTMNGDEYDEFMSTVDNAENRITYELYGNDVSYARKKGVGCFTPSLNRIEYDVSETHEGRPKFQTIAHEFSHKVDAAIGRSDKLNYNEIDKINSYAKNGSWLSRDLIKNAPSASDEFLTGLRKDMEAMKPLYLKGAAEKHDTTTASGSYSRSAYMQNQSRLGELLFKSNYDLNASSGIQDALDGFFGAQDKGKVAWGHGDRYYNRDYARLKTFNCEKQVKDALNELGFDASNQAKVKKLMRQYEASSEVWANVGAAVTNGGRSLELMEEWMPNTVEAYKEIIGGL